jgi:hypothetical protein
MLPHANGQIRPQAELAARIKSLSMTPRNGKQTVLGDRAMRPVQEVKLLVLKQWPLAWPGFLETRIADHPKKSLSAALSLGVLLGWIVKRH